MYNLLISLGIATAAFLLAGLTTGAWVAGFIPALLALIIAYFLLARRTGKQLEARMMVAMGDFQANRIEKGRKHLQDAMVLAPWQFLVKEQVQGQLGSIEYMMAFKSRPPKFKKARAHLEQAWSRSWQPMALLAVIDYREKKLSDALERLEKLKGSAGKEATFWGLYAWIALEKGDNEKALAVLAEAQGKLPDNGPIKEMTQSVQNKRKVKMKIFGQPWYQFFPEHMPRAMQMQMSAANQPNMKRGGYSHPMPKR